MISVIISIYREPIEYIIDAVNSILKQTYRNLEIIVVVDDPKNNDAIEFLNRLRSKDNRVQLLINNQNIGLVGSLNKALELVTGEYIARMDADDFSLERRLERQLMFLEQNNLDIVGCNILDMDKNGSTSYRATLYPESPSAVERYACFNCPIAHPTWLAKKEVYEVLKGYREIDACEDYDFITRALANGFKIGNIQEVLFKYRINRNGISSTKKAVQKTSLYYLRKNYRRKIVPSIEDYQSFMDSKKGQNKCVKIEKLYRMTSKYRSIKNDFGKFLYLFKIILISHEGRSLIFNEYMSKVCLILNN